jgi:transcriptional regulator with XRE-family HTH domain
MARQSKSNRRVDNVRFGDWLRALRDARSLPLRVVAAAAEMDQAHLSKVELGHRMLTPEQAAAIARFFHVDETEIEARRIAEKFRVEHAGNPAAKQAINILHETPPSYGKK